MPQFAIHKSPSRNTNIPYVVQVQSTRLDRLPARVVLPLTRRSQHGPEDHPLTPHMTVLGEIVFADPLNMATIPARLLGEPLGSLPEPDQDRIIRAVDEMISRA